MKPITEHPFTPSLLTSKDYFWNCRTPEELHAYYAKLKTRKEDDREQLLAIAQNERKLLTLIRSTIVTLDGWCSERKSAVITGLVLAMRPKLMVEIGVFAGRSLLPLAITAKALDYKPTIIGIDPYSPQESAKDETPENAKWWASVDHEAIYEKLKFNLKQSSVTEMVTIERKKSDDFNPPQGIDYLSVDGSHTEQATRDAERYGPCVKIGGVAVMDDLHWASGGVLRAVDFLESIGFVEAFQCEDWSVLQRVR